MECKKKLNINTILQFQKNQKSQKLSVEIVTLIAQKVTQTN
jgi:hypothetical protein